MKLPSFHLPGPRALAFTALLGATAAPLAPASRAADLVVDASAGDSPYRLTNGTLSYTNVYVGLKTTGLLNQTGGVLNASGDLTLGLYSGSGGVYTLSAGTLNTVATSVGINGTGSFTLSGTGVENVTGTNGSANGSLSIASNGGSSGTYNLNGGTLTASYVRGGQGASTFNFNGGTLTPGASATGFLQNLTHAYVLSGGATIDTNGYNVTVAQALASGTASGTADGGLTKLGAGTLTLSGASTYTGVTTVSAGTLAVGSGGSVTGDGISVGAGATLAISGTGSVGPGSGHQLTVDGTTASPASVTLGGTGSLSTGDAVVGNSGAGTFTQSGGTFTTNGNALDVGSDTGSSGSYTLSGTGSLSTGYAYIGSSGAGTVTQSGGIFTTNGGLLILGAGSGSSGSYTLSGTGSLSTGDAVVGYDGAGTFTQSGGTFTTNGGSLYLGYSTGLYPGFGSSGSYTLSGTGSLSTGYAIIGDSGTGTFTQSGGTFTTNGNALFLGLNSGSSGTYNLSGGTLNVVAVTSGNPGMSGTSAFNFNGGTLQASASNTGFFGSLTTANVQAGGARIDTQAYSVTVAQNLLHDTTGGAAVFDGGLTKLGAGTLTLTGANTYTGNTTVSAGTLILNGGSTASRLLQANPGGQIQYTGGTVVGGNLAGGGTQSVLGGGATFSSPTAGVLTIFNGATLNIGGPTDFEEINSSGTVAVASGQTLTWNNGQNNLGTLAVSGTANTSGWASTGVITVNNGGALANSGSNLVLGGGSRTTVNAGGTLSTASGTTVELNGALLTNNGTLKGTVNVNYGSTLKGSGSAGSVNVSDGGRFGANAGTAGTLASAAAFANLGASLGLAERPFVGPQLQATPDRASVGSLTLGGGSTLAASVQDARGAAGAGYDTVSVGGALTLSGSNTPGNLITIALASLAANGTAGPALNFDSTQAYTFVLASAGGGVAGFDPAEFAVNTGGFQNNLGGGRFFVALDGNSLDLDFAPAVPEPATWLGGAGAAGLLGLGLLRRARRTRSGQRGCFQSVHRPGGFRLVALWPFAFLVGITHLVAQTVAPPPVAPVRPVTDDYFGTKVVDPYRWMEQAGSPEFADWLKGQAGYTQATLEQLPDRAKLLDRVLALGNASDSVRGVQRARGCLFYFKTAPGEDNRKLFVRPETAPPDDPGRLLFDPTKLGSKDKHVSIDYFAPSPDGKIVAIGYSEGGSENSVLHFLDVADGHDLNESIDRCQFGPCLWRADSRSVFYNRLQKLAPDAPPDAKYLNSRAYLHVLGTDPQEDPPVFGRGLSGKIEIEETDVPGVVTSAASPYALGLVAHGVRNEATIYTALLTEIDGARTPWRKLVDVADEVTNGALHGDDLFLLSHHGASRFQVLRVALRTGDIQKATVVVPASETVLADIGCAADALYVRTLDGGLGGVLRLPYEAKHGAKPAALPLPFAGAIAELTVDPLAAGVVFPLEGWVSSPVYLRYDPASGQFADTRLRTPSPLDFSGMESFEVKAKAADGTLVPLSIVAKKGLVHDGSAPTLLKGYGAYGVSSDPYFDPATLAWLERGGVLAYAHVRGGGDYGEDWHLGGQKLTKPNTWNDFIACAEYLVAEKWTSPAHLAGSGGSAGGILIGRAITSRPELFGAAVISVGDSNTLRCEKMAAGPLNIPEFGTTADPEGFRGLYEMDAMHHVADRTAYPAVLLTAGVNDPRVEPWQTGKMAARLQAASNSGKPVLLRVDFDAGHGLGSTKTQHLTAVADIDAFLLWQIGSEAAHPPNG